MSIERISYHYFIPSTRRMSFVRWSIISINEFAVSQNADWFIECWKKKLVRQVPASRLTYRWGVQRFRTQTNNANNKPNTKRSNSFFIVGQCLTFGQSTDGPTSRNKDGWKLIRGFDQCFVEINFRTLCVNQRMWISDLKNWETTL
jgi:hypothetical protein